MTFRADKKNLAPQARVPLPVLLMIAAGIFLMLIAAAGIFLVNSPGESTPSKANPVRVGARMDNFTLLDLEGRKVSLSDYRGRPVLVNAWATWCPPCRVEMPDLNAFYLAHRDSGFIILAVNAGETREQAAGFASQLGLKFPVLLDADYRLMDRLAINDYPTSILVGGDGVIKAVHIGLLTPGQLERDFLPFMQ